MIWDELTWEEIDRLDRSLPVLLPLAATEQHGPHLPLATDRMIAEHFAASLDRHLADKLLVLPTVVVGCSDHHMDFAGTLSLQHETFAHQVTDVVRSVLHHGFKKVIMLNCHGGNSAIGRVLIDQLGKTFPHGHFVLAVWWRTATQALGALSDTGMGGTGHACEFETSLMMHLAPHLVRNDKITAKANRPTYPWAEGDMLHGASADYYRSMKQMTPTGVVGEPTAASAEKGRRITEVVVDALARIAEDVADI